LVESIIISVVSIALIAGSAWSISNIFFP
jgi:hypothetical protein